MGGQRRKSRPTLFPVALLAATALTLGALALIGQLEEKRSVAGAGGADALPPAPPAAGAFARGGRPDYGDERVRQTFAEALPGYAIALDDWARSQREGRRVEEAKAALAEARAALTAAEVEEALGEKVAEALEVVAARARRAAAAADPDLDRATDALARGVLTFNDALAAAGLGYFVDSDVLSYGGGERVVLLFTFRVQRVARYRIGGEAIRALRLERLDPLNWTYRVLGFTAPQRRDALVLLDKVDERLLGGVLPALAPGATADLWDLSDEQANGAWYPRLSTRAAEVVRATLGGALEPAAAEQLGSLVGRRLELFDRWNRLLAGRGLSLEPPTTLTLEWDVRERLSGLVPADDLEELLGIEASLGRAEVERSFGALRRRLTESVERHEVQHRADAAGPPLPMPAPLSDLVGPLEDERGRERRLAVRAQGELSAYLAELARDPLTSRIGLTLLAGFLADRRMWGSAECYATLVIFGELARELELETAGSLLDSRRIDRERAVDLYIEMSRAPAAELRKAARRVWERLFGRELGTLEEL